MLLLSQGIINEFYLTVTEFPSAISPQQYYYMVFTSTYSAGNVVSVFPTIITQNNRYTEFQLDCSEITPNLLLGQCNFQPGGSWTYNLYIANGLTTNPGIVSTVLTDMSIIENCSNSTQIFNFITGP